MSSPIAPELIEDYLMRLCFGSGCDFLELAVARAYRELAPTLRRLPGGEADALRACSGAAKLWVHTRLRALRDADIASQADFDTWHRAACEDLVAWYCRAGRVDFTIGQAQKWINTALKYAIVLREERVPGFMRFARFFHLPLDRMTMAALCRYECPRLPSPWSRLTSYNDYLSFQQWIRENFAGFDSPLEVYFLLWQGQSECLLSPNG